MRQTTLQPLLDDRMDLRGKGWPILEPLSLVCHYAATVAEGSTALY